MDFMKITPEHPGNYYAFFYLLAFLAGFVFLMIEGRRRNFPVIPWMLVIATAFLFFMLGCRLIAFSRVEWGFVFRFESIPYLTAQSVLGGILFCVPGILLAKRCLGFKPDMMDAFAQVLPLGILVQRFGCLLTGCCFGTPSTLPWAIQYGVHTHAYTQHIRDGLLTAESVLSLPVHPVQFYEVLCCLAIIIILGKLRKVVRAPGNLFFTSIALYCFFRFLLEYVRSTGGHPVGGGIAFGLNFVQWAILLILPLLFLFIRQRENKFCLNKIVNVNPIKEFFRPAIYFLSLGSFFLFVSRWMSPLDVVALNIVLLPMLARLTWYLFTCVTIPRFRIASFALPLVALLLMNQTLPEYSKKDSTRLSYNTISLGWIGGSSSTSSTLSTGSCNNPGTSYSSTYKNSYSAEAIGITRTVQRAPDKITSFGIAGFMGEHHEVSQLITTSPQVSVTTQNIDQQFSYYGLRPYVQFDRRRYGVGLGFNVGQLHDIAYPDGSDPSTLRSSVEKYNLYPSFSLRLGDLRRFFFEYKFANQFPTNFPALNHQLVWGIGFGKRLPGNIRLGTGSHVGFFIAPCLPIGKHLVAEACVGWGRGFNPAYANITHYSPAVVNNSVNYVSLHYKFNRKEKQ